MNPAAPEIRAVDQVLVRMDANIARCLAERSRLGYFAVLYRGVTERVRDGILAGEFDDGARMARLLVVFASRYLDALDHFRGGRPPTRSWRIAFECGALAEPIVLQHLLLGMNAHINLDLAIAAAQTAPGADLPRLEGDFTRITVILDEMIEDVQARIQRISPWFFLIDWAGGRSDEQLVGYGIRRGREVAWQAARSLAAANPVLFDEQVLLHDAVVAALAEKIRAPGPLLRAALRVVRMRENRDVARVMAALTPPPRGGAPARATAPQAARR